MNEIEKNKTPISKKVSIIVCFALAWLTVIPLIRTPEKTVLHVVSLFVCNLFLALGINLWFFLKKRSRISLFLLFFYDFLILVGMNCLILKNVILSATQNPG